MQESEVFRAAIELAAAAFALTCVCHDDERLEDREKLATGKVQFQSLHQAVAKFHSVVAFNLVGAP